MQKIFGLIGFPLSHSFSKDYFTNKFREEGITGTVYENFELQDVSGLKELLESEPDIAGLNVTIPHKASVMKFLNDIDPQAKKIGAVNVIRKLENGKLRGYNSDYYGFRTSLESWLGASMKKTKAIVLGTGGASRAVRAVLEDIGMEFIMVSRSPGKEVIGYYDLRKDVSWIRKYTLIINTTPLGMYPRINEMPNLPYEYLDEDNYLYDLIYNPEKSMFLQQGEQKGAGIKNGREMLVLQAERSWQIWNNPE
jgi:shikimate dehydrogenase